MMRRVMATAACLILVLAWLVAGCSLAPHDFYPLEAGRFWTYRLVIVQGAEGSERRVEATSLVVNLPERAFAGETVVPQRQEAFGAARIRLIRDDGESVAEVGEASELQEAVVVRQPINRIIGRPLTPGASWSAMWETMQSGAPTLLPMQKTVTATDGVVAVAAGRFDGCLGLAIAGEGPQEMMVTGEEWFAPGVGLVRASFRKIVAGRPEAATRVDLELADRRP